MAIASCLIKLEIWSRVGARSTYLNTYFATNMKQKDKNVRKLTRTGKTSLAVTVPIEIIRSLGWREKQKVTVKKVRGGVLIKDWKK